MNIERHALVVDGIKHGLTGYTYHKCRCPVCKSARADYVKTYRESPETDLPPGDPRHGRRSTYIMRGCRCELCMEASRAYYRNKRERQADVRSMHDATD